MIFAPETMAMPRLTARAALGHRSEETMTRFLNDAATIHAILDAGLVAHVGFNLNGQPAVIPTLFGRAGNHLYLHVSPASMLREIEEGVRACVTVTVVDGLVLARSAAHQFVNHRTVVAFGTACKVEEPAKKAHALHVISDQLIQGRWQDVSAPSREELQATAVLEFLMEEVSAKTREGLPVDEEQNHTPPVWSGILPLFLTAGKPVPDPRMAGNDDVPEYIRRYMDQRQGDRSTDDERKSFSLAWHGLA
jgi:nitroimidazol reductase NimA-like FMN-containing flavoprotein (pyridoxamine 5'-phosphate oxidase superfamily)